MVLNLIGQILVAAILGGIIGFDREKLSKNRKAFNFAGIRTSSLIGILGALTPLLYDFNISFAILVVASFLVALVGSFLLNVKKDKESGATSEIAIILTLIIGFLVGIGYLFESVFLTLFLVLILSYKNSIHLFVEKVSTKEFKYGVLFLVLALVIHPLLPNADYGPYGFFNLKEVWTMLILISGISFVSYIFERIFTSKNTIYLTSFLGGIISSTATTLNLAILLKKTKDDFKIQNAIIITSIAMFIRVLLEVSVVNLNLGISLSKVTISFVIFSLFIYLWKNQKKEKKVEITNAYENPFEIKQALFFSVFYSLIKLTIGFLEAKSGVYGVYISSFVSGFIDTDAVSLALASRNLDSLDGKTALMGIILALVANQLMKLILVTTKTKRLNYKKLNLFTLGIVLVASIFFYLPLN
ncbi:MgtC/SapB family protein [bacterium]|jgi:uncharacterized membrane protein (DUF4010 family)|nr:MgtC/SapB family protein [bacterium]MBT6294000.1 MgtC/SapB family protein [bacterium]